MTESGFDPSRANVYETLFTVGNGRLGTRGTLEEGHRGELSGTYLNGVYDTHDAPVIDLVNAPDWLSLAVRVDGSRLDVQSCSVVEHERALDIRQGLLYRRTLFEDGRGRRTRIETLRFASLRHRELCAVRMVVTPENHESLITVESAIDGHRRNLDRRPVYPAGAVFHPEVKWEKWALSKHLDEVARSYGDESIHLRMRTIDSGITLGYAATLVPSREPVRRVVHQDYERIAEHADFVVGAGEGLRVDKLVATVTSRDLAPAGADDDVRRACLDRLALHRAAGFDAGLAESRAVWDDMWWHCDCEIVGDPRSTKAVRFGIYHLLIAANGDDPTVNIGAKSLSGEGYRGHVFWDTEVLMLPFFIFTQPETARSLLRYRHHTLPGARELAAASGTRGARYAWESADSGREECPAWTADGVHRIWARDEEIHVSGDVAYGILTYVAATGDTAFLHDFGAEILFETSRFWADRAVYDGARERYSLEQVMGPDEFHSHVDDNAFTNHLARWHLRQAVDVYRDLAGEHPAVLTELAGRIALTPAEVDRWARVAAGLGYNQRPDGLIEQFDGYFQREDIPIGALDENDMPRYPPGYHHFNCEDTMLLKQPDVVMLPYMLPEDFSEEVKKVNFEFYESRTLHKSSLSPAIHAIVGLAVGDSTRALQYFSRSVFVDLTDNQGNTEEGMHIASAAGSWQVLVCGFGGFRVMHGKPAFTPWLPDEWREIRFRLRWRGNSVAVSIGHREATFRLDAADGVTEEIVVRGAPVTLTANTPSVVAIGG